MDIIFLCETYFNECMQKVINMPEYNMIYKNRKTEKNGGVAVLLKDHLKYTIHDDLSVFKEGEFESGFTTFHFKKGHDITVGSAY